MSFYDELVAMDNEQDALDAACREFGLPRVRFGADGTVQLFTINAETLIHRLIGDGIITNEAMEIYADIIDDPSKQIKYAFNNYVPNLPSDFINEVVLDMDETSKAKVAEIAGLDDISDHIKLAYAIERDPSLSDALFSVAKPYLEDILRREVGKISKDEMVVDYLDILGEYARVLDMHLDVFLPNVTLYMNYMTFLEKMKDYEDGTAERPWRDVPISHDWLALFGDFDKAVYSRRVYTEPSYDLIGSLVNGDISDWIKDTLTDPNERGIDIRTIALDFGNKIVMGESVEDDSLFKFYENLKRRFDSRL